MARYFWSSSQSKEWIFDKNNMFMLRAEDMKIYNEEEYNRFNIFWANFITAVVTEGGLTEANTGCRVRQRAIATAITFFKRFYLRHSFQDMCPFLVAGTSFFLACKVEEHTLLSVASFLKNALNVLPKRWGVTFESATTRTGVIQEAEFIIVEVMDCSLIVFHPTRPLVQLLEDLNKMLQLKDFEAVEAQCHKVVNDSLRCDVGFVYAPHCIAISSIIVGMELMGRGEEIEQWLVELDVDFEQIAACTDDLYKLYATWKAFDEKEEVKNLICKLPRPNEGPSIQPQRFL